MNMSGFGCECKTNEIQKKVTGDRYRLAELLNIDALKNNCMCSFSLPFSGTPEALLQRARHEISNAGGAMNGNDTSGTFQAKTPLGSIQGTYEIVGQSIQLNITKKPFIISCKRIQRELEGVMR
jgi:hypothetical protein